MTTSRLTSLLRLQAQDTRLDQLRHRLERLEERTARDHARLALEDARSRAARIAEKRDELVRVQRRLQDEAAVIDERRRREDARLYDGSVTNPRELQDLQDEVEALGRRIADLEDQELEIMEQLEPVEEALAEEAAEEAELGRELDRAEAALIAVEAEIGAELDTVQEQRAETSSELDPDLRDEYEQLRRTRGGIVATAMAGNRCGSCNLELSAVAVAGIKKHSDTIAHCEDCGSILIAG